MIKDISKISGLSEVEIEEFFQTWEGLYNINDFTAIEFSNIIKQHLC